MNQILSSVQGTANATKDILRFSFDKVKEAYPDYLTDESRLESKAFSELVFVHDESQIVDVLKQARQSKTEVTVSAGRTGITGGAVACSGILLSLEKMNRFLNARYDEKREEWQLTLEPGVTLEQINEALDHHFTDNPIEAPDLFLSQSDHYFYPPDPTEMTAHLGGTVATNASGARSYYYGSTRSYIRGLRVILIDGTVLSLRRGDIYVSSKFPVTIETVSGPVSLPHVELHSSDIKSVAGYFYQEGMDLIDLFIGSEGTLGVISQIDIALRPKPESIFAGIAFFPAESDSIEFVKRIRKSTKVLPVALEFFDSHALEFLNHHHEDSSSIPNIPPTARSAIYFEQEVTLDTLEMFYEWYDEILTACHTSMDETWGALDEDELHKIKLFRHALPETVNGVIGRRKVACPLLHKVSTDFAVPENHFDEMYACYKQYLNDMDYEYVIFGHIGESHLHVNILPRNPEELEGAKTLYHTLARKAVSLGGSISAEHGIGKIKTYIMEEMFSSGEIEEMKKIKRTFDPDFLLGPGNIFT